MKLTVGTVFESKAALVHCTSTPSYNPITKSIEVDTKALTPNLVPKCGSKVPVWHGSTKKGYADVRNEDPDRAYSLWMITEVETDPHGCGSTSMVNYGHTEVWARHFYKAKRISFTGADHDSGETLSFSSSGFYVKDLQVFDME
jgi:hypothetical protein